MSSSVIDPKKISVHSGNGTPKPPKDDNGGRDEMRDEGEARDDSNEIRRLRKLLIKSTEVGEVLPSAVTESSRPDLTRATLPIVEENIRQSAARDPKILAEALFPVIGPAIRKSIAEALSSMIQSFNQTLEYSVTPRGMSWRLEAWRTGKSLGEIVMLRTLLYRVEQVFLIHNENGILLQHVAADPNDTKDADMVSAMLTAIRDFVKDSFETQEGATLDALRMEELSVWIEHSPDASIAVVIRGNPPMGLRDTLSEAIEEIQFRFEDDLEKFNGNAEVFVGSRPILERCIQSKTSADAGEESEKLFTPSRILAFCLGAALLISAIYFGVKYWNWIEFVQEVKNEPGYMVTDTEFGFFEHSITGLRDPLAQKPTALTDEFGYSPDEVEFDLKPFVDASSIFILKRANTLLSPPPGATLDYDDGTLIVKGNVSPEWTANSERLALAIGGVDKFVVENQSLSEAAKTISAQKIDFVCNSADLSEKGKSELSATSSDIEKLIAVSNSFVIEVEGFASSSGNAAQNLEISARRAEKVRDELISGSNLISKRAGEQPNFLVAKALGNKSGSANCEVGFNVVFGNK